MLINDKMGEPFISDASRLLCDAAVALPARIAPERDGIPPYTTSTAMRHGWSWDVPLFHRRGCGYVYCSRTLGVEDAERELRAFLGEPAEAHEAKHLRMRVGRTRNFWSKNCVAIGLSGSFIEPLESTGIFLIEYGLATLLTLFPSLDFEPGTIQRYNDAMRQMYEEVRDFIVLHYVLSRREDTEFWRAVKHETDVPDSLRDKLEHFGANLPVLDELNFALFPAASYACILDGFGRLPSHPYSLLEHIGYEAGERALDELARRAQDLLAVMPSHYDVLLRQRENAVRS
jgi:tryptophan halogenase